MTAKIEETVSYINFKTSNFKPDTAIILGSGLGSFCDDLDGIRIKYCEIPNFAKSTIEGHKGELLFCEINSKKCVVMEGRFHYYEGYSLKDVVYPIKVFSKLGVKRLFITNAAGATSPSYKVGDIMLFSDHINFLGDNPLIGPCDNLGERFPDMSQVYSLRLQELAKTCAKEMGLDLQNGVYLATSGPSYETKAEVKAFRVLGADAVGMSSVPEAIEANYLKMEIVAFSLITNVAGGLGEQKLSHSEVLEMGKKSGVKLADLIKKMISII